MWVKIWTALPSTTPRPAPKSSADDLACDLWERPSPVKETALLWLDRGQRRRTLSLTDSTPARRSPDRGSNCEQHRQGTRHKGREAGTSRRTAGFRMNRDGSRCGHPDYFFNKSPRCASLPSSSIDSTFRGLQV